MSAHSVSDGATTLIVTTDPGTHRIRLDIDVDGQAVACLSLSAAQAEDLAEALDLRLIALTARAVLAEQDRDKARDERDVANALRMGTLR